MVKERSFSGEPPFSASGLVETIEGKVKPCFPNYFVFYGYQSKELIRCQFYLRSTVVKKRSFSGERSSSVSGLVEVIEGKVKLCFTNSFDYFRISEQGIDKMPV